MSRGIASAVGVALLLVLTVTLAGAVAVALDTDLAEGPPVARFSLEADAAADRVSIVHETGEPVEPAALAVEIRVAGVPLAEQPPVPFFAAPGFRSGPQGPFNSATDGAWTAGERATLRLASTNHPSIDAGDRVRVVLRTDRGRVATLSARAS